VDAYINIELDLQPWIEVPSADHERVVSGVCSGKLELEPLAVHNRPEPGGQWCDVDPPHHRPPGRATDAEVLGSVDAGAQRLLGDARHRLKFGQRDEVDAAAA
jgi:hypothetical protein